MHSSPFRPKYNPRRESYSSRFESDDANDIKILPFSSSDAPRRGLSSVHDAARRRSSLFVNAFASSDTPSSPVMSTPLRKAPIAPTTFSSDTGPSRLRSATDYYSRTHSGGFSKFSHDAPYSRPFGHATAPSLLHHKAGADGFTHQAPSTALVMRNAQSSQNLAHSLHEELLRAESQKQDAVLYSEKLQLQLDMQKEENSRLERMVNMLRSELSRAGKQASDAVVDSMQKQIQEQSRAMMEQLEYRLSRMQDVLLTEGGSSTALTDVSQRVRLMEDTQGTQLNTLQALNDKIAEMMHMHAQEQRNAIPEAMNQIESIKDKMAQLMRREFSELQHTIEELQDQVASLRDELDAERNNTEPGKIASMILTENQQLTQSLALVEKECSDLHAENEQLKIAVRQAEGRAEHYVKLANHASELAEIKSKSSAPGAARKDAADTLQNHASFQLLQQQVSSLQEENKRLISYQDELLQQVEHVTKQRDHTKERLLQAEKENGLERSENEAQIHRLRQELNNSSRPNQHLKDEINSLKQQLQVKEQKLTQVTTKLNQSESQLQHITHEFQSDNGRYVKEIQSLEQQVQSLRRELDAKDQQLERFRLDQNNFRDEEKRLRDTIQMQSDTLARLQTQIELLKTDKVQAKVGETIRRQSINTRGGSLLRSPQNTRERS